MSMMVGMVNSPISATISGIPPCISVIPKVNRTSPPTGEMPIVEISSPSAPAAMPLSRVGAMLAIMVRPKMPIQKYSWGPKASTTWASSGASTSRPITPMTPPKTDPIVLPMIAPSLRPCWVIG